MESIRIKLKREECKTTKKYCSIAFLVFCLLIIMLAHYEVSALGPPPFDSAAWSAYGDATGNANHSEYASADRTTGKITVETYDEVWAFSGSAWSYTFAYMVDYYSLGTMSLPSNDFVLKIVADFDQKQRLQFLNEIINNLETSYKIVNDPSIRQKIIEAKEFYFKSILQAKPMYHLLGMGNGKYEQAQSLSVFKNAWSAVSINGFLLHSILPEQGATYTHTLEVFLAVIDSATGQTVASDTRRYSQDGGYSGTVSLHCSWYAQSGHAYVLISGFRLSSSISCWATVGNVGCAFKDNQVLYIEVT
ncbi:MAG: hypothetical protein ACP5HX_05375 [Thermoproteota archaeon]|jgi:hypothetical protein